MIIEKIVEKSPKAGVLPVQQGEISKIWAQKGIEAIISVVRRLLREGSESVKEKFSYVKMETMEVL